MGYFSCHFPGKAPGAVTKPFPGTPIRPPGGPKRGGREVKKALWKVPQGLLKGKFPVYSASVTAMAPVRAAAVRGAWGAKLPAASAAR